MTVPPSARFFADSRRFPCTYYTINHGKSHVFLGLLGYSVDIKYVLTGRLVRVARCTFVGHIANERQKIAEYPNINSELSVK